MKEHVVTTNVQIGRRLLCKSRMEVSTDGDQDISGVLMGDDRFGAPLATIVLLYTAHLFAPSEHIRREVERAIHAIDPNATLVADEGYRNQAALMKPDDDIPF